jgi:hypothetical protein
LLEGSAPHQHRAGLDRVEVGVEQVSMPKTTATVAQVERLRHHCRRSSRRPVPAREARAAARGAACGVPSGDLHLQAESVPRARLFAAQRIDGAHRRWAGLPPELQDTAGPGVLVRGVVKPPTNRKRARSAKGRGSGSASSSGSRSGTCPANLKDEGGEAEGEDRAGRDRTRGPRGGPRVQRRSGEAADARGGVHGRARRAAALRRYLDRRLGSDQRLCTP